MTIVRVCRPDEPCRSNLRRGAYYADRVGLHSLSRLGTLAAVRGVERLCDRGDSSPRAQAKRRLGLGVRPRLAASDLLHRSIRGGLVSVAGDSRWLAECATDYS